MSKEFKPRVNNKCKICGCPIWGEMRLLPNNTLKYYCQRGCEYVVMRKEDMQKYLSQEQDRQFP